MPITQAGNHRSSDSDLWQKIIDAAAKIFPLAAVAVVLLYSYIFYGLFTGQVADATGQSLQQAQHALQLIGQLSMWLNISLVVMLVTSLILHYEEQTVGYIYLGLAALFAYGLNFVMEFLFTSESARLKEGAASTETLKELHLTALFFAVAGILLVVRGMFVRVMEARNGSDLVNNASYGKDAKTEDVPKALIGAAAKCWQLPFCREGVRKGCPIYHARTKCWKQRIGCMCEENVIRLSAIASAKPENTPPLDAQTEPSKGQGFVPIGDLIMENERKKTDILPTRIGPRGIRIPTNPHLTDAQKKMRCHNCVIFNEHQRQKYQLFSPLVTLLVPLLVWWKFEDMKLLLGVAMHKIDGLFGALSFSGQSGTSALNREVTGSLPVTVILIVCLALVLMTWALRFLEYCMFKIKI